MSRRPGRGEGGGGADPRRRHLHALLAAAAVASLAFQGGVAPAKAQEPAGVLLDARLVAVVDSTGGASLRVRMRLAGVAGWDSLPVRALGFGGRPTAATASVNAREPMRLALESPRPGFHQGTVPLLPGHGDTVTVTLAYRIRRAVVPVRDGEGHVLGVPWLAVPWPPPDGAPGRVVLSVEFPEPVEVGASFPAHLSPSTAGSGGVDRDASSGTGSWRWETSLPVLPSLTRAEVAWTPPRLRPAPPPAEGWLGPGTPPESPAPGFVFTGVFAAFGLVLLGYVVWMVAEDRRERRAIRPGGAERGRRGT